MREGGLKPISEIPWEKRQGKPLCGIIPLCVACILTHLPSLTLLKDQLTTRQNMGSSSAPPGAPPDPALMCISGKENQTRYHARSPAHDVASDKGPLPWLPLICRGCSVLFLWSLKAEVCVVMETAQAWSYKPGFRSLLVSSWASDRLQFPHLQNAQSLHHWFCVWTVLMIK